MGREWRWRPLDRIPSLKVKFGIVIVAAVAMTAIMSVVGLWLGWPVWVRPVVAGVLSLVMVNFLAKGTTYPLRRMARAAEAMADGDYDQRVHVVANDEVGQLAGAFNRMVAELAEVERQRTELVANVSHELRTPIAAIQMNLENLVDGVTDWDTERGEVMLRQTQRLSRLVTQLLDLAKLESGAAPLHLQPFDLEALLGRVAAESDLGGHDRTITVKMGPSPTMVGDPERLHQLVANLVDNAVRHSPPGGAIGLTAHHSPGEGRITIDVSDTGPGIPANERERVFERFHRVESDRSARTGGTGLGLAIARWIVELHGGTIHATQNEPTGCRMVVKLPTETPDE